MQKTDEEEGRRKEEHVGQVEVENHCKHPYKRLISSFPPISMVWGLFGCTAKRSVTVYTEKRYFVRKKLMMIYRQKNTQTLKNSHFISMMQAFLCTFIS